MYIYIYIYTHIYIDNTLVEKLKIAYLESYNLYLEPGIEICT